MGIQGSVTGIVQAPRAAAFDVITDIQRLADWNDIMTEVVTAPSPLERGAEWVVGFKAMGSSWRSRSRVETIDRDASRFAYRSMTDDGNPSFALWTWDLRETDAGTEVTVSWDLHPATFWRRVLLARIRSRQLRNELPASLVALDRAAAPTG